jgi:hypothetical protein
MEVMRPSKLLLLARIELHDGPRERAIAITECSINGLIHNSDPSKMTRRVFVMRDAIVVLPHDDVLVSQLFIAYPKVLQSGREGEAQADAMPDCVACDSRI